MNSNEANEKSNLLKYFSSTVTKTSSNSATPVLKNVSSPAKARKQKSTESSKRQMVFVKPFRKNSAPSMFSQEKRNIPLVELNSEDSSNGDDEPIKNFIVKNSSKFLPNVVVPMLSPTSVAKLIQPNLQCFQPGIAVVDISSDSDTSDDEPIAKKFSPSSSSSASSGGENRKITNDKSLSKPVNKKNVHSSHAKRADEVKQRNKQLTSSKIDRMPKLAENKKLFTKEKLNLLKKQSGGKMNNVKSKHFNASNSSKPPKLVRADSSSSLDDKPLSEVSKILSSKTGNVKNELKSQKTSPTKFLSQTKTGELRFRTTVNRLEKLKSIATAKPQYSQKRAFSRFAQHVVTANVLTEAEIERISNVELKKDMLFRLEREKLKKMTDVERKAYYDKKHSNEVERRKKIVENEKQRYEDCDVAKPSLLPDPKQADSFDGLSNECFGDVLMITEFVQTFVDLFSTENKTDLKLENLTKALTAGHNGFELLGKVLMVILQNLLQEQCPVELGTKIDEIELNVHTVAELVRLYLIEMKDKKDDDDSDEDESKSNVSLGEKLEDEILELLSTEDFFRLQADKKLKIINSLIHELLQTNVFDEFLKAKEEELSEAWRHKFEASNEYKKYKPAEIKPAKGKSEPSVSEPTNPTENGTKQFDGESNENKNVSLENEEDDMIYRVKHRRMLTQREREKERLEKEKEKKEYELALKASLFESANKKLELVQSLTKMYFRNVPLGVDRNHSRYWYFPRISPFLFVERGWSTGPDSLPTVSGSPKKSNCVPFMSTTFPPIVTNTWFFYDSVETIDNLISSLIPKGIRESHLKECLVKRHAEIVSVFETFHNSKKEEVGSSDDFELRSKEFLRGELFSTECKVREGGLGGSCEFDEWKSRLDTASTVRHFAELLIETQQNVRPQMLRGMMAVRKSSKNVEEEEDDDDQNEEEKQKRLETAVSGVMLDVGVSGEEVKRRHEAWIAAVLDCGTWSRLAVLLYMFKNCVMWDRSIENARCNKCHKNKDDDKVILCETCNAGYHIYCLRPPLKKVPDDDWFCEQCKPPSSRTRQRAREVLQALSDDEDGVQEHDDTCARCSEGANDDLDELILCASCPSAFHKPCHEPPLRHTPRVGWRCCQCTKGVVIKRNLRKRKFAK